MLQSLADWRFGGGGGQWFVLQIPTICMHIHYYIPLLDSVEGGCLICVCMCVCSSIYPRAHLGAPISLLSSRMAGSGGCPPPLPPPAPR